MSDPVLRDKILQTVTEHKVIKACTRSELKAIFGMQQVGDSQFERALGRLGADKKLCIYNGGESSDRGQVGYKPRIVSLRPIDLPETHRMFDDIYRDFLDQTQQRPPRLALV